MPAGFFAASALAQSKTPALAAPACGACGLFKQCKSPKMPVSGKGRLKVLVIAEAPGAEEDKQNKQLIGEAGQTLRKALGRLDIDLDLDCWKTNALICRPPNNRTPTTDEINYCRPNLTKTLKELQPEVIIPMGAAAVEALIGLEWAGELGSIGKWAGWQVPDQELNAWVCPTYHPSYILRCETGKPPQPVPGRLWARHLAAAFSHTGGRPWPAKPEWGAKVLTLTDVAIAARYVRQMVAKGGPVAFDYETNMLKPDYPEARIVSCSVSWRGKKTIAYPWHGEAIKATAELLRSPLPKIAANLKFEDRWTRKVLGHPVRAWLWDTMQTAHVLDNRRSITGLEFQAYARLGFPRYSDHITPFLRSSESAEANRIFQEIGITDLLRYNGLDSLLEYKLAELQMQDFGLEMP